MADTVTSIAEPSLNSLLLSLARGVKACNALPMSSSKKQSFKVGKSKTTGDVSDSDGDEGSDDDEDDDDLAYEMAFPEYRRENEKAHKAASSLVRASLSMVGAGGASRETDGRGDATMANLFHTSSSKNDRTKPPMSGSNEDDEEVVWEKCADTSDALLEQVERHVAFMKSGSVAPIAAGSGGNSNNKNNKYNSMMSRMKNIEKSQITFGFRHEIDNDRTTPFNPKLAEGPKPFGGHDFSLADNIVSGHGLTMKNATDQQKEDVIAPQQHYPHPYEVELEQLQYSDLQFQPPKSCSTWNDLPAIGVGGTLQTKDDTSNDVSAGMSGMGDVEFIEDLAGLQRFVLHMQEYDIREMAVDLEAHNYRSFSGFVCLMQISVRWPSSAPSDLRRDLIVDTLALRKHMGGTLLPLFANPQIVKVMHGADSDIQWLQRDFGLYLVNLFDTHQAAITLALPSRGLGSILHRYASVTADKKHQLSDWRQRPLPSDMLQYAQSDTHYLLDVYDVMRRDLAATISTSDDGSNTDTDGAIGIVLKESKRVCSFNCLKEPFHPKGWQKLLFAKNSRPNKPLTKMQQQCLHLLWDWRDAAARDRDESLGYVCSNRSLIRIASRMPHTVAELTRLINPVPDLVREYAPTIVSFVHRAASGESVQVTGQQGITKKISQEAALPSATSHQDSTTIVSKPAIPAVQDTFADINDVGSSSEEDENDCGPESVSYLALDPVNKGFQSSHHTIISSHSLMSKSDDGHHAKTPSLRHAMVIDGLGAIRAVFNSKDEGTGTDRAEEDAKKAIAVTKRILQRAAEDPNPCFFTAGGFLMPDEDDEATRNAAAAKAKAAVAVKAKEEDTSMPKSLVESYNLTDTIKAPKSRYSTQKKEQVAKSSEHGKNSDLSAAQKVKKEASTAAATTNSANKERSVSAVAAKSKDVITPFDYSNTSKSTGISLEGNPFFSLSSGPSSRAPRDRNNKGKNNNNKRKGNSPASGDSKNGTPNKKKNKRVAEYPQKLDGNRTTVTKRGGA